jgi:hypothetical protein
MALLKYLVPATGEDNTSAEPKVDVALAEILKVVNGELTTANLEAGAGITEGQLAAAVQEKLVTKLGLIVTLSNASLTATNEHLYLMEKEGSTLELPTPTANRMVGISCAPGVAAVKLKASSGKIYSGPNPTGATTVEVTTGETLLAVATGANWLLIGEPLINTARLAGGAVTEAKLGAGAVTDSKLAANRIAINTANNYKESETATHNCGETISPAFARPTWVQGAPGVLATAAGAYGLFKLIVNGSQQSQCRWLADAADSARVPFPFLLPAAATYEYTCEATGGGTVVSTSLRVSYLES